MTITTRLSKALKRGDSGCQVACTSPWYPIRVILSGWSCRWGCSRSLTQHHILSHLQQPLKGDAFGKQGLWCFAEVVQQLLAVAEELKVAGTPLGAGPTAKAWATQHILQRCIKRGEKLVIFCQYLTDLDNIEAALQQVVTNDACVRWKAALVPAVNHCNGASM